MPVSLTASIPVLGLKNVWPWPREGLSLASDFFVSLASSLMSSTPPLTITLKLEQLTKLLSQKINLAYNFGQYKFQFTSPLNY